MNIFKKATGAKSGFALMEDPFYFYASDIVELSKIIELKCLQLGFTIFDVVISKINRKTGNVYEWCVYVRLPEVEDKSNG